MRHWNEGIADVVPEIEDATTNVCPDLKFTIELVNSEFGPVPACRRLATEILPRAAAPMPDGGYDPSTPYPTSMTGALRSYTAGSLSTLGAAASTPLPLVSSSSTAKELDVKGQHPYFGRTIPSNKADAYAAIDYLVNVKDVAHLGVLYVRDNFGLSFAQALQDAAAESQVPVKITAASYPYEIEDDPSLLWDALDRLKSSDLTYFFLVTFDNLHQIVVKEAYKRGVAGPGKYWMYGKALNNYYVTNFKYPAKSDDDNDEANDAIPGTHGAALIHVTDPSDRVGERGHDAFMRSWRYDVQTTEGINYLGSLLPYYAKNGTNEEFWNNFKFSDMPMLYGFNQYDAVVAMALAACKGHAKAKEAGDDDAASFTAEDFFRSFASTELNGAYGHVSFDKTTGSRDYSSISYTVRNVLANDPDQDGIVTFRTVSTEVRENGKWKPVEGAPPFVYSDGTTSPPPVLPPLDEDLNLVSTGARAFGLALSGTALLLSIIFGLWTWKHRNTPVVRASQGLFLYLLCAGTFVVGCAIVPMSLQEPIDQTSLDVACMSVPWLLAIGFTTVFSSLFSKLMRVNKMFEESQSFRRVVVRYVDVMKPFAALLFINVAVLSAWTAVSPLRYVRVDSTSTDMYGRPLESRGTCFPDDPSFADVTFLVLWAMPNVFALLFANFQAYKARRVSVTYSESRYIGLSMVSLLQVVCIGVPSAVAARESPTALFIINSFVIAATCGSVLLPTFLPKMAYLRHWQKQPEKQRRRSTFSNYLNAVAREVRQVSTLTPHDDKDDDDDWADNVGDDRGSVSRNRAVSFSTLGTRHESSAAARRRSSGDERSSGESNEDGSDSGFYITIRRMSRTISSKLFLSSSESVGAGSRRSSSFRRESSLRSSRGWSGSREEREPEGLHMA